MSAAEFEVWDVTEWEIHSDETEGQEEKWWLIDPSTSEIWLFKPPVIKNGVRQGEDWAERVSTELADLIRVPCARVQLGVRDGRRGSMSRDLKPPGWELQSGQLLLAATDPSYQTKRKGRPGHSLGRIREVLRGVDPPHSPAIPSGFDAFDVFAGYMVLDAWIANRDRHDDNWAILLPPPGSTENYRLSDSYDQSSSLGYNVRDCECTARLRQDGGVQRWTQKGTAWRFEHDPAVGPPTLVDHAVAALGMCRPAVGEYWLDNLRSVSHDTATDVLLRVPELSEPCRTFAGEILRINRERLLGHAGRHY
ncbi:hypothetical protein CKJ66_26540 [Mycobacterium avium]|uniref:HipA-like C-terminal domain-containing protein n=1 Tax=Mycobacterium avium TaxID=1764 RepID=A0A2A2ZBN6_MYCAV|nr:hypothetical protein [Mycobacterium avium]PBA23813.1 hypothetical protein CKJ66_26540 [Mycobacterium avium]